MNNVEILDSTIDNFDSTWKKTYNIWMPLEPRIEIKCPICSSGVRFKEYNLQHRSYKITGDKFRVDMFYKCVNCGFVLTFGVPVDSKYYYNIKSKQEDLIGRSRPLHILEYIDLTSEK